MGSGQENRSAYASAIQDRTIAGPLLTGTGKAQIHPARDTGTAARYTGGKPGVVAGKYR